jgi:putative redox protein
VRRIVTPPEDQPKAPALLIATAHSECGDAPHAQRIKVGHHVVTTDEPASNGGGDTGPSPTTLLLASLAACTATTLRMYADRKTWTLGKVRVHLKLLRTGSGERIERMISFEAALEPDQITRLLEIAEKTPVTKLLKAGVPIATRVQ